MNPFWFGTLVGFIMAGILFQFVPSADLFDALEFSKKNVIKYNCGGYDREGNFEWYYDKSK